jgi:hypothetical protein
VKAIIISAKTCKGRFHHPFCGGIKESKFIESGYIPDAAQFESGGIKKYIWLARMVDVL